MNLLLGKLKDLARNLCPELGQKGSIPHEEITLSNLLIKKPELINYLRQDILLLGGIMKKAQEIYWTVYNVDIERKITVSLLALTIFRMKSICTMPNNYQETISALLTERWDSNLPYRGICWSRPSYTVIPISGYLFEKKESPFKNFVSSLFESRLEAKKSGNNSMSFMYKILMNSLYGRFEISPASTKIEICDENRYKIDWHHMNIIRKETLVRLGIKLRTKRDEVFKDDLWVDTKLIEIKDLS
ncbi:hypothetical protein M9H77_18964 [Catharanthus roseus]|uniref:Uncharacterized protein n=1 Tax=Catharanthus roseus TaxID=4058 RepID=A0ACC0B8Y3_CATRO|nr:hypothetical protein M9H77_18964 [Catharanthus roseus]